MASTYTSNNGLEKIGTGEQAGTWGTTTNTNFDILDRAVNGVGAITLSGTTHTLTTTDGAASEGHYKVLVLGGSPSGTNTITISPNDQDKLYFVYNNSGQTATFTQGSGGNISITTGKSGIIYADGAGSGAKVSQIETGSSSFTEDVTMKTSDGHLLTLQTSDTTITSGDVLGGLQFQAPNESGGTDAILVGASILGVAEDTFTASVNKTKLSFRTGASEAAAEKMALDNGGDLKILTDGASIFFGADSEIELRHVADDGLILKHVGTGDGKEPSLTFQAGDTDIAADDVLGSIFFQAPDEGTGTDAILVAAGIEAVSEGDFSSSSNATKLSFKTASSAAASETMSLSSAGVLTVSGAVTSSGIVTGTGFTAGSAVLTEAELETLDGITAGTVAASKAVIVDSNKDASGFRNVTATGTVQGAEVTATSDERLKSDITTIDDALNKVMQMRGVNYTKSAEKGMGVIAQEVEKVIPEVVTDGEYKSVAYGNMVGVLIEAIKDLKKELDEHKQGCQCNGSSN